MKNKYIYCPNCGTKNSNKSKVCKECKEKIEVKDHLFREFIYNHTKDKIKSDITDNIFSLLARFLISHLFGAVFVATIVFTGVSTITYVNNTSSKVYTKVKKAPVVSTTCHKVNSLNPVSICSEGYELVDGKCLKESTIEAKENNVCENGYYLKGSKCVSNKTYTTYEKQCIVTDEIAKQVGLSSKNDKNIIGAHIEGNLCYMSVCNSDGWVDGKCNAGSNLPISFTSVPVCAKGTTLIDGECRTSKTPKKEYTCEKGELDNNKCIIKEEETPSLSCQDGYIFNDKCNMCDVG